MARIGFAAPKQAILLVGGPKHWGTHLGQSIYLRDLHGRADGPPPPVDLHRERQTGDFVRRLIRGGIVSAAHDVSDGGLGIALAEMAIASGIGAQIPWVLEADPLKVWFGEDQGRYILTLNIDPQGEAMDPIWQEAMDANIGIVWIGETGGASLKLGRARAISVQDLKAAHESWFPAFMAA
jgi:phosphoribosylformylglycinamidine synthase